MTQPVPPVSLEKPCVICTLWQSLPHHKRWSTPIMPDQAEAAMVMGYWLKRSLEGTIPKLCEKHGSMLFHLDDVHEARQAQQLNPAEKPHVPAAQMHVAQPNEGNLVSQTLAAGPAIIPTPAAAPPSTVPEVVKYPCPFCRRMIVRGEVHACPEG